MDEAFDASEDVAETNLGLLEPLELADLDRLREEWWDFSDAERDGAGEGDRERSEPEFFRLFSESDDTEFAEDDRDDIFGELWSQTR